MVKRRLILQVTGTSNYRGTKDGKISSIWFFIHKRWKNYYIIEYNPTYALYRIEIFVIQMPRRHKMQIICVYAATIIYTHKVKNFMEKKIA